MPEVIWKYPIFTPHNPRSVDIEMPEHADIVTLRVVDDQPVIYVRATPSDGSKMRTRRFVHKVTGEPYEDGDKLLYVGTWTGQHAQGQTIVVHTFEVIG